MKKTASPSSSSSFFSGNMKTEEVRQIQQRILRVKSGFLHDVGIVPNIFSMPIDDIDQIFTRCKQIEGELFYSGMKIKEGECYQASYDSGMKSDLPSPK